MASSSLSAQTADVTIHISVRDPAGSTLRPPRGDMRWVVEGKGDFSLAEQNAAIPTMRISLPLGIYQVTVWELSTLAAASHQVALLPGTAPQVQMILDEDQSDLVHETLSRLNPGETSPPAFPAEAAPVRPKAP